MTTLRFSHTAWLVMMCQLGIKKDPRWQSLLPDVHAAFYQSCYDYCMRQSPLYRALHYLLPIPRHVRTVEKTLAFGAPQHYALRKKAIAEQLELCLTEGTGQVIVMGGGFDALALHMARAHPQVAFFELDTPSMHVHKMNIARAHFGRIPENFYGIGNDFSKHSLYEALSTYRAFSRDKKTLFIAEGVMMYLNATQVDRLFKDIRALCAQPALLFTAIERHGKPETDIWNVLGKLILLIKRERFSWSMSATDMPAFLKTYGLNQQWNKTYAQLQQPYRAPEEYNLILQENGEYLAYAT